MRGFHSGGDKQGGGEGRQRRQGANGVGSERWTAGLEQRTHETRAANETSDDLRATPRLGRSANVPGIRQGEDESFVVLAHNLMAPRNRVVRGHNAVDPLATEVIAKDADRLSHKRFRPAVHVHGRDTAAAPGGTFGSGASVYNCNQRLSTRLSRRSLLACQAARERSLLERRSCVVWRCCEL